MNLAVVNNISFGANLASCKSSYPANRKLLKTANSKLKPLAGPKEKEEAKKVKCDIALIPIGGTYTMTPLEAAELINTIRPQIAIPTHYGTITGSLSDGEIFKEKIDSHIACQILIKEEK